MSSDRTVLDHLLEARAGLVREIDRLTAARNELDAVIGRVDARSARPGAGPSDGVAEPAAPVVARAPRSRSPAAEPARSARRSGPRVGTDAPKSIRVHVVEMLAAEDRAFGLAEIIERIHGAGIRAHDDAVRSITIKLMKNGTVDRVGRGHYRLARRPDPVPEEEPVTSTDPAPGSPATEVRPASASAGEQVTPHVPDPDGSPPAVPPELNLAQPWPAPQS
jgi:hypothetical protein